MRERNNDVYLPHRMELGTTHVERKDGVSKMYLTKELAELKKRWTLITGEQYLSIPAKGLKDLGAETHRTVVLNKLQPLALLVPQEQEHAHKKPRTEETGRVEVPRSTNKVHAVRVTQAMRALLNSGESWSSIPLPYEMNVRTGIFYVYIDRTKFSFQIRKDRACTLMFGDLTIIAKRVRGAGVTALMFIELEAADSFKLMFDTPNNPAKRLNHDFIPSPEPLMAYYY